MYKTIGYTTGAFDLFHIGHLNIIKKAKSLCDELIVGVSTDELIYKYKQRKSIIPFSERLEIVRSIKYVDLAIAQINLDKYEAWKKIKFNKIFVGDDWFGSQQWNMLEKKLKKNNVEFIYFPYTDNISTTKIKEIIIKVNQK